MNTDLKLEEIEYKPLSVREILRRMKDLSSLMVDLAYFAYINENREIADLVMALEKEVDKLVYLLYMNATLSARDKEDAEFSAAIIKIGSALNEFANAAADIAGLIRINIPPHRYIKEAFEKAEEIVDDILVSSESTLVGKRISDLESMGLYIDIIALKRQDKWILSPSAQFTIQPNDILIVRGNVDTIEKLIEVCRCERA
mgnify:CR=1 FL=1